MYTAKPYSKNELETLQGLIKSVGHLTYQSSAKFEKLYEQKTGVRRASGALYMAAWRLEHGYYDIILSVKK